MWASRVLFFKSLTHLCFVFFFILPMAKHAHGMYLSLVAWFFVMFVPFGFLLFEFCVVVFRLSSFFVVVNILFAVTVPCVLFGSENRLV